METKQKKIDEFIDFENSSPAAHAIGTVKTRSYGIQMKERE